jgi:hypothetical protein
LRRICICHSASGTAATAGQGLQTVLEVVARHRLTAGHARPLQQLARVLADLGAGHHHLDGRDFIGLQWSLHLPDKGRLGPVQCRKCWPLSDCRDPR